MTSSEAANYYLETVCPANAAIASYDSSVDAFNASSSKDLKIVTDTAGTTRDAAQVAGKRFDDSSVRWPARVAPDIPTLRDAYFADASEYGGVAVAKSLTEVNGIKFSSDDAAAQASQRIRSRLGVSSDTTVSCKGH